MLSVPIYILSILTLQSPFNHLLVNGDPTSPPATNDAAANEAASCAMRVGRNCDDDGSCRYKVNVPSFDIVGEFAQMFSANRGGGNFAAECSRLGMNLEIIRDNQAAWVRRSQGLLSNVTKDLTRLEVGFTEKLTALSNSVRVLETKTTQTLTAINRTMISAANDHESDNEDEDSIALLVRMGKLTTPRPKSRIEVERNEQKQSNFEQRILELQESLQQTLKGMESKLIARIEQISAACSGGRTSDTVDDQPDTEEALSTPAVDEGAVESSKGPQMMLCRTCCERVSFAEYTRSQENDDDAKEAEEDVTRTVETTDRVTGVEQVYTEDETQETRSTTRSQVTSSRSDVTHENNEAMFTSTTVTHAVEVTQPNYIYSEGSGVNIRDGYATNETEGIEFTSRILRATNPTPVQDGQTESLPYDCAELYARGVRQSGVYDIRPGTKVTWTVYCDMDTDGGGWTMLQRRIDGIVNFSKGWKSYKNGFGDINADHWIGLEKMHHISTSNKSRRMELRINLTDWDDVSHYANYGVFRIRSEGKNYQLIAKRYTGTAGDALNYGENYNHHLQPFTTFDRDNDGYALGNCGRYYRSGWWFNACFAANLNGNYYTGPYKGVQNGIYWGTWYKLSDSTSNSRYSFKYVDMKVRPLNFNARRTY
uniref:Fibrinogen-like protein n=1 Tax=Ciona intestinalis TaxID=7719 RepID=Q9NDQ1_CIOIN|nr:fibrinogen-like protein [Ciona intestinalis]BAB00626.1 fibrinogen-like protein [Ciona intestinalis]|eukprot:NP_001027605.1 fibrinogen-like protein [Ciona intestinalis]